MGGLTSLIKLIPGVQGKIKDMDFDRSEKKFAEFEAIIQSMTPKERKDPSILNASRRKCIVAGSGQTVNKINTLIKKYNDAKKMMKQFNNPKSKFARMLGELQ